MIDVFRHIYICHHLDGLGQIVIDHNLLRHHEGCIRHADVIWLMSWQVLDEAYSIIAQITHQSSEKSRQPLHRNSSKCFH